MIYRVKYTFHSQSQKIQWSGPEQVFRLRRDPWFQKKQKILIFQFFNVLRPARDTSIFRLTKYLVFVRQERNTLVLEGFVNFEIIISLQW